MVNRLSKIAVMVAAIAGLTAGASAASAAPSHHTAKRQPIGVQFAQRGLHRTSHTGYQRLVSDGPGTGFGFNHDPLPYRVGAWRQRYRQAEATHQAVIDDALTSGGYNGFPGDSVYGEGNHSAYGVFNGADGYGTPYFAGYYGPASGTDYGPFGRAYDD